jgi:hypothetical protein
MCIHYENHGIELKKTESRFEFLGLMGRSNA